MRTLRVTFITHQPLDVHNCEEGPTFLSYCWALHTELFIVVSLLFMNQTCCDVKTKN